MSPHSEPAARAGSGAAGRQVLGPAEFSERLQSAQRTLWLITSAGLGRRTDADDVVQEAADPQTAELAAMIYADLRSDLLAER